MNNDRFLTRVWDKREKRMIYPKECSALEIVNFLGKENCIPMQCTGFREDCGYENVEDGIPAFEFDFIKTHAGVCLLVLLRDGCWIAESLDKKYSVDLASLQGKFSIRSNKFELDCVFFVKKKRRRKANE